MATIGVLFGMENVFPGALVERINAMGVAGVTAEFVQVGGVKMEGASPYRVIVDRISHDIPFYRAWLKIAALDGAYVISNPFWGSADDKFFNYALAHRLGVAVPPTVVLPHKEHPAGTTDKSMRNMLYPLNWDEVFAYIGFPAFLKPFDGGGWRDVFQVKSREEFFASYDQTRSLCMTLQRAVNFTEYFRCYVVGQQDVHVMPYDPRAPFHERYIKSPPAYPAELIDRVKADSLTLCRALGYDLNTVEFAVEDGVPYAIDFMNPAPDADPHSVGADNFEWIVDAMARFTVKKAQEPPAPVEYRWSAMLKGAAMRPSFSIGIEEEYQTIDPDTFDLRSHIQTELMAQGKRVLAEKVKAEMHQSVVEVGTGVCRNMEEARADMVDLRRKMLELARENGLLLVAGATHPFADWRVQDISPDERYLQVVEDMQLVARSNLIFGLHVHVGVEDRETIIHLMNQIRYFLPHLLALSTNSPFWLGMNTGLKSYRCKVFDKFPRTNIPDTFSGWADYEAFVNLLIRTNCIDNAKKIWWDVRPHPFFPTIEVRICDLPMRVDETLAIAALIQATVYTLWKLHEKNQAWRPYSRALIMENKWRASRYGIDGSLIDFGRETEVPERQLLEEYLGLVGESVDELGSGREIDGVRWIMQHGTGADRQLAEFARSNDLRQVVQFMVEETRAGL